MENVEKQAEYPKGFTEAFSEDLIDEKVPIKDMVVVFADMLGTKNLMMEVKDNDEKAKETYNKLRKISEIFRDAWGSIFKEDRDKEEIISMEISDSFVLAVPIEKKRELIEIIANFQYKILEECNELMRGGVANGEIIDWNSIENNKNDVQKIIGPAFVSAHILEKENAIYPRIVLDSKLVSEDIKEFLMQDDDGFSFINFKRKKDKKSIEYITNKIQQKIKEASNDKIKQKYNWLLSYLYKESEDG